MKEIKAIIQPHMLDRVVAALHELPHFPGLTVLDVIGQGRGRGKHHAYKATLDTVFSSRRKRIEIICADDAAESIAQAIRDFAHTGRSGDGIITIAEIADVIRIRSGERGEQAV
jgi:nitrogen regulatory protein P-II 1